MYKPIKTKCMNTVQLAAAIQYWDRFNLSLLLKVLEHKYQTSLKDKK
jgi:hypothetical protein